VSQKFYVLHDEQEIHGSVYEKVADLIGPKRKVVDFGCATGSLARTLAARGCSVFGVDINTDALRQAAPFCTATKLADLDTTDPADVLGEEKFEVAVFADVLEHLRDPWHVLRATRDVLADDGFIVVSIPNVSHAAVIFALIEGRFEYQPEGILDDTHLRFFTRRSVFALIRDAGFTPTGFDRTIDRLASDSPLVPHFSGEALSEQTVRDISKRDDAETLQFIVRAHARPGILPTIDADQALENAKGSPAFVLADELDKTRTALEEAGNYARTLLEQVGALEHEQSSVAQYTEKLLAEIAALKHEHDVISALVLARDNEIIALSERCSKLENELEKSHGDIETLLDEVRQQRHGFDAATRARAEADMSQSAAELLRKDLAGLREHFDLLRANALNGR
jgi:SAM-dependent methyltransferase